MELTQPSSVDQLDGGIFIHGGTEVVPLVRDGILSGEKLNMNVLYFETSARKNYSVFTPISPTNLDANIAFPFSKSWSRP